MGRVCGEQLLVVINDTLDLSKMEENKMVLECRAFSIRTTLEESLEVVHFEAERKRIDLLYDIDPSVQVELP